MATPRNRRRSLFVHKDLQGRIILAISWPVVVCLALNVTLLGLLFTNLTGNALESATQLHWAVPVLVGILGCLAMAAAFFLFNSLKISHRMVGPLVRISSDLKRVMQGDLHVRVRVREGDYLGEIASDLNVFLDWVQQRIEAPSAPGQRPPVNAEEEPASVDR